MRRKIRGKIVSMWSGFPEIHPEIDFLVPIHLIVAIKTYEQMYIK